MSKLRSQYCVPECVLSEVVEGEMVLLNLSTGMYFGLNRVGTLIWGELCDHGSSARAFDSLCQRYSNIEEQTMRDDLDQLLEALLQNGLLEPAA